MTKTLAALAIVLFSLTVPSQAQSTRFITLKDGSQIQGRVISLENGQYTIESATLGQITLDEANVVSISTQTGPAAPVLQAATGNAPSSDKAAQAAEIQNRILADPQLLQEIQAMAEDPAIIELISDPAFLQAAQTKNYEALENNPRTKELMNNPRVKALIERLGGTVPK